MGNHDHSSFKCNIPSLLLSLPLSLCTNKTEIKFNFSVIQRSARSAEIIVMSNVELNRIAASMTAFSAAFDAECAGISHGLLMFKRDTKGVKFSSHAVGGLLRVAFLLHFNLTN
jgi:hypothetical protein